MTSRLLALLLLPLLSSCVEFNEACTAPVDDAEVTVAKLKDPIYIDKPNARHANNAFGQAAADGFKNAFEGSAAAQLGVINSGDLRAEGYCAPRNLFKNQIRTSDVYEVLLFDNLVYSLEVDEARLVRALQHSVNTLTRAAVPGTPQEIAAPPARFLQISKELKLTVDCKLPAGQRVTVATLGGKNILTAPSAATKYRVAMPEFLMLGGDGYSMFKEAYDEGVWSQTARNEKEAQITAAYLAKNFGKDTSAPLLAVEQRVTFVDCAIPLPPSAQ